MIGPKQEKQLSAAAERRGRNIVKKRDRGVCVKCRRVDPVWGVNHDHRLNRSQGGDWSPANGQLLCGSGTTGCHGWVTTNPEVACAEGWAVPGWADPATYPGRRWVRTRFGTLVLVWVLYRDDGTWAQITDSDARRRIEEGRMYGEVV